MADDSEFARLEGAAGTIPQAELYRSAPMTRSRLNGLSELVYLPLQRTAHILPVSDVELLLSCFQFRTLFAHAEDLRTRYGTDEGAGIVQRLCKFAALGMLISHREILEAAASRAPEESESRISWLAIPTCSRPDELARALRSYLGNAQKFGRSFAFLIADDSRSSAERGACKRVVRETADNSGMQIFYAGQKEKIKLMEALAQGGEIPLEVIRFALFGHGFRGSTIGANRNAILLQTLGSLLLSVDDDTICQAARMPGVQRPASVRVGSHGDLGEICFFPDRNSALQYVKSQEGQEVDIAAEHERLLGRSVCRVIQRASEAGAVDLQQACPHLLRSLYLGQGHIAITLTGLIGDSGMHSNMPIRLYPDEATRERLTSSEEAYRLAMSSREVVRHTLAPTISHTEPFGGAFFGLDNRDLLPPFFPVYRNEDGIFAHLLSRFVDHFYAGHLPFALVHAPTETRSYTSNAATAVRISDVIIVCLSSWTGGQMRRPAADQLRSIGQHLAELGALPQDDFDETIRILLWNRASAIVNQMASLLGQYGGACHDYWVLDLKRQMQWLEEALISPHYSHPVELLDHYPSAEVPGLTQQLVRQFGELLCWWPIIVEKAKEQFTKEPTARRIAILRQRIQGSVVR